MRYRAEVEVRRVGTALGVAEVAVEALGSPATVARRRSVKLTWYVSPAAMCSWIPAIAASYVSRSIEGTQAPDGGGDGSSGGGRQGRFLASLEQGEPREWEIGERIAVGRRPDPQRRVETRRCLVGHHPGHPEPARRGRLGGVDHGGHLRRSACFQHADRLHQPEARLGAAQVVEARLDHAGHDTRGCLPAPARLPGSLWGCHPSWSRCPAGSTRRSPRASCTSRGTRSWARTCRSCTSTASSTDAAGRRRGDAAETARIAGFPFEYLDPERRVRGDGDRRFPQRARVRTHPEPVRAVQRRDQVRGVPAAGRRARRRPRGDRALRARGPRRPWLVGARPRRGPREGSELHAPHAGTARAGALALPHRRARQDGHASIAERFGLPVATKPDSQELCFAPAGDAGGFVRSHAARWCAKAARSWTGRGGSSPSTTGPSPSRWGSDAGSGWRPVPRSTSWRSTPRRTGSWWDRGSS